MTTPQAHLYMIEQQVRRLIEMFEGNEEFPHIRELITQIYHQNDEIGKNQEIISNQMNLIIKLLAKDEKRKPK